MATFPKGAWNHLRGLVTTKGVYSSVYLPGNLGEKVVILAPDGSKHEVRTPALGDWFLTAQGGRIVVYYARIGGDGNDLAMVVTDVQCGEAAGALVVGGLGPVGPSGSAGPRGADGPPGPSGAPGRDGKDADVDEATMQRIAALTAEQVLLGPPAGDHYGLPAHAQFGTRHQENIAIMFANQGFWQEVVKAIDEAALNLLKSGYVPKVGG